MSIPYCPRCDREMAMPYPLCRECGIELDIVNELNDVELNDDTDYNRRLMDGFSRLQAPHPDDENRYNNWS